MSRAILLLATTALATPAWAQQSDPHAGHNLPASPAPADACTPEHAAMGHCQLPKEKPAADPHAGHHMPSVPTPPVDPHAGHDMSGMAVPEPQPAPPPAEALTGPLHAAPSSGRMETTRNMPACMW